LFIDGVEGREANRVEWERRDVNMDMDMERRTDGILVNDLLGLDFSSRHVYG